MSKTLREVAALARDYFAHVGKEQAQPTAAKLAQMLAEAITVDLAEEAAGEAAELAKLDALMVQGRELQEKGPALPLRAMLASSAMQGLLTTRHASGGAPDQVAVSSVQMADALLAALDAPVSP